MMNRFAGLLREINEKLDLPQPEKSRVLLEMAADLDDLYNHFIDRGMSAEEAAKNAEERFDVSDETLAQLVKIHENPMRVLMHRLSEQARSRWERLAILTLIVFIVLFAGRQAVSARFFMEASNFIWIVLGISFATAVVSISKAYTLYLLRDHRVRRLRAGLLSILILGGMSLLTGLYGLVLEMHFSVGKIARDTQNTSYYIVEFLWRCSPMLITSLLVAILAALVWFVLFSKVSAIERAEAAILLETRL